MKNLKIAFIAVITLLLGSNVMAQMSDHSKMDASKKEGVSSKTEMIKISGNCESCKSRIEKAAKVEGVSKADWNEKTKMLTLVYNPSKVKSDDVQKKIAAVGHDTPKFKADVKIYNALPGCCKYR